MEIIDSIKEMATVSRAAMMEGRSIAYVPTMGFLHKGHISLVKEGRNRSSLLVVSIFVNPAQFGEGEDFDKYPRDIRRDTDILEGEGVDILFLPSTKEMYPDGFQTYVEVERLSRGLCGTSRPGHFRGVATVVAKLLNIVRPDTAIFGEKDFQQLAVIRRMASDLRLGVDIVGMPVVRENDGLAMSSRNTCLSVRDRLDALSLHRSILRGREVFLSGVRESVEILKVAAGEIADGIHTEYLEICNVETLEPVPYIEDKALFAIAARVGNTRLIDNTILKEEIPCTE